MSALELKDAGNRAFAAGETQLALSKYSDAISTIDFKSAAKDKPLLEMYVAIHSNRAACYLRLAKATEDESAKVAAKRCVVDCDTALEHRPGTVKALYRRAQAKMILGDSTAASQDLNRVMYIDPKNVEAGALLRKVRAAVAKEHQGIPETVRLLRLLRTSTSEKKPATEMVPIMRALAGLCSDDSSHARDFTRNGGVAAACAPLREHHSEIVDSKPVLGWVLSLICAACEHPEVAKEYVNLQPLEEGLDSMGVLESLVDFDGVQLSLVALCQLVDVGAWGAAVSTAALTAVMRILRAQPLFSASIPVPTPPAPDRAPLTSSSSRVEELPEETAAPAAAAESQKKEDIDPLPYLPDNVSRDVLRACRRALQGDDTELLVMGCDALVALYGECEDYFTPVQVYDTRLETLEERRHRFRCKRVVGARAARFAAFSLEEKVLDSLILTLDNPEPLQRARAVPSFGRLILSIDDPAEAAAQAKRGKDDPPPEEDLLLKAHLRPYFSASNTTGSALPSLAAMKLRAVITGALLAVKPTLGIWALQETNGMQQTLFLVSTGDARCQDVAAEVMCLAAAADGGQELLATALESGALHELMKSPHAGIRAAAASTITKLSLRAKALDEQTPEVSAILNAALDVIKLYKNTSEATKKGKPNEAPASLSSEKSLAPVMSGLSLTSMTPNLEDSVQNAASVASLERAIEVIAAMAGRTHIKEELVHGSFRVQAAAKTLSVLDLDARSSAAYGLAHIFSILTVTNGELHKLSLAEKDITPEQYAQLTEMQRIKGVKDDNGNPVEEKKEVTDPDTDKMCRTRIKAIVNVGGFSCLVRLLTYGSTQTKEHSSRALRQMCIEESVRGSFIQQGALKACCEIISTQTDKRADSSSKSTSTTTAPSAATRREAAHAVSKVLVTTNPTLLQEHARLGAIQPLIYLAKDVDSTNLQQFESLMALTNLVSLGEAEQNKFIKEKGVPSAHYLMFSDHFMVRRAACEVFCNIPLEEALLNIMRKPDQVRLWVGLCYEWSNEEEPTEGPLIARAVSGTLASAANDSGVCAALIEEDVGPALTSLLQSGKAELIHRAFAVVIAMIESGGAPAALHLLENNCVPGIAKAHESIKEIPQLVTLAKEAAQMLSAAIKETNR